MILFISSILLALSVSFCCSLMESTLLSISPAQVADMASKWPRRGLIWQSFKSNIERPISVILLLNTAAHTIGATLAGSQFDKLYGDHWITVFSFVFTFVMLQFTEILPKTLGVKFNRKLAGIIALPLHSAVNMLNPVLNILHWINKPFSIKGTTQNQLITVDEISALASLAQMSRQINPLQERIIRTASRLTMIHVHQVMIPVDHISFISTDQSLTQAIITAHTDAHTRYPVCRGNDPNQIAGYVNFKEMIYFMRTNPHDPSLLGVIRPVHFVNPDEPVSAVLRLFVDEHIHIAIVRNKNGSTLGMITLEDLIQELVGDIEDEFDRLPKMLHSLGDGKTIMVGGGVMTEELANFIKIVPSTSKESVSDWIIGLLGHTPRPGDIFAFGGYECTVRRVRREKVFEATFTKQADAEKKV